MKFQFVSNFKPHIHQSNDLDERRKSHKKERRQSRFPRLVSLRLLILLIRAYIYTRGKGPKSTSERDEKGKSYNVKTKSLHARHNFYKAINKKARNGRS